MQRFYWIVEDLLAGCSRPGASGNERADLSFLRDRGIGAILSLTETPLEAWLLDEFALVSLHLPVMDMTAPQPAQFQHALAFIDDHLDAGRPVAVHCLAGQGRTGSILAAWLVRRGRSPDEALECVRNRCPGAVENDEQVAALYSFAVSKSWLI